MQLAGQEEIEYFYDKGLCCLEPISITVNSGV